MNDVQQLLEQLQEKGWTLLTVADDLGVSYSAVRKWSAGMRYPANAPTVKAALRTLLTKERASNPKKQVNWSSASYADRLAEAERLAGMFRHVAPGVSLVDELSQDRIREAQREIWEAEQEAKGPLKKSLYDRLGGYEAIAGIVSNLYDRMVSDPQVWYYWKGHSSDYKAAERQLFTDLVCASAGGPVIFQTQGVKTNHKGLGISKVEWGVFVGLAAETLDQSGLNLGKKEELFSLLARSKAAITVTDQPRSPLAGFAGYAPGLTDREKEVLRLVALGKNNTEIAGELIISINTVTRHLTNIFVKTSTRNRVEAAVYAARRHLV
jgi:hemoglobin